MLNKAFDPNVDIAEFTREYYRKQGEERLFRKIREALYDVGDINVVARVTMLLNEIEFGEEDSK
jgi:3-polyprenyl-4-hydroxybenzoate decarboxylase